MRASCMQLPPHQFLKKTLAIDRVDHLLSKLPIDFGTYAFAAYTSIEHIAATSAPLLLRKCHAAAIFATNAAYLQP